MQYRPLGRSNLNASIVGLGAWVIGGGSFWGPNPDDRESLAAIQAALDAGINLIDTAPGYGFGRSEEVIGKAIKGRRDRVLVATKCGLWWDDERGSFFFEIDGHPIRRSLRPDTIQVEIEHSLRRLGTDYIDLYQTHWPSVAPDLTPIADTVACLMKLKAQGKIRALGVSNVSVDELKEYGAHGEIVSDQLRYSMLYREPERALLPYCAQHQIATLTYMSLEQGLLTGKIGLDRVFSPQEIRGNAEWNPWYTPSNRRKVLDLLAGWRDLTDHYHCTLSQLVIAWTAAQAGVTHVLTGGRTRAQVEENAKAGALTLSPADAQRIRQAVEALGEPQKE